MGSRAGRRLHQLGATIVALAMWLGAPGGAAAEGCAFNAVTVRGDFGSVRFNIEVADEVGEQMLGLMDRPSMPFSSGMLFVYPTPRPASFWMRNTLIPLDMIFTDARGVITHIHHMAKPLDETPIFGGDRVLTVLEINGGLAKRLGIKEGAELRHSAFGANDPAWPC